MESDRMQSQVQFLEDMKKMADELKGIEELSKSLASKAERVKKNNAGFTDKLMASLKTKLDEVDQKFSSEGQQSVDDDISQIVLGEIERQLGVEIDLANSYSQLEKKSGRLKEYVSTIVPRFSPDGDFGQLPMIQAVKNYHAAVAAASRNFNQVPSLTVKLLQDLRQVVASTTEGITDLSALKDKLRKQYEILRRTKGRVGNSSTSALPGETSKDDLEAAGWRCHRK